MVYLIKENTSNPIEGDKAAGSPIDLIALKTFSFSKRLNGNEEFSFQIYKPSDLDIITAGGYYSVYADYELQKLLVSFQVQNKKLNFNNAVNQPQSRTYTVDCLSNSELLSRARISFNYKSIKFKTLIERVITLYRQIIPQISADFQFIEDVDYTFPVIIKKNITLEDFFAIIQNLGYQILLRPDYKIQAGKRNFLNQFHIDLDNDKVDNTLGCIRRNDKTWIDKTYNPRPITDLIAKGGSNEEGTLTAAHAITNKESVYDLLFDVNFESNFIYEPFNTSTLEGFEVSNGIMSGWNERFALYNTPIKINTYQLFETSFEILESKDAYFLGIGNGALKEPLKQLSAWYIENGNLYLVANQQKYLTPKVLKPYQEISILAVNEDFTEFTLSWINDLKIGDKIAITGNNTTITLANAEIIDINGSIITVDSPALEGEYNSSLKVRRITAYELRTVINNFGKTEYYFRESTGEFEHLGTYSIAYPENNFIFAFNCYEPPTFTVDEGIWELGGYALDYFFTDKANLLKVYDDNNKKLVVCTQAQTESVRTNLVINSITKNGKNVGQIQFIAPSLIKLVLANKPITTTKIPLTFSPSDVLNQGMRVLINDESRLIDDFFIDEKDGFITLTEPLSAIPTPETQVWINTSIPADDTNFFIQYAPNTILQVRDRASDEAIAKFNINQQEVDLSEYTNVSDLLERMQLFLADQVEPKISGNISLLVNFNYENNKIPAHYPIDELPTVGQYIKVTNTLADIIDQPARIEAFTLQAMDTGLFNLVLELGQTGSVQVIENLLDLKRALGVITDESSSDTNFNLPIVKRDFANIEDTSLEFELTTGYPFYSGAYRQFYSGNNQQALTPIDVSLDFTVTEGFNFISGVYKQNYSGSRAYQAVELIDGNFELYDNGHQLISNEFV